MIIQKVLTYICHSILSIYSFIIHSTNISCAPTGCQPLIKQLAIQVGTTWTISALTNLTLKYSRADRKQRANI